MTTTEPDGRSSPSAASQARPRMRARGRLRRRLSGILALSLALLCAGALYAAFVPEPQVAQAQDDPALVREGEQLYNNACITCHGANLQGVEGRGPSLIGVGEASVFFQVSTGRMPAARQEAQAPQKPVRFSPREIDALGAYVQANGGGPRVPDFELGGGDPANGGQLFRLNCASCHQFTGRGIALSSGKFAPELDGTTPLTAYTAMISGPQNMPTFSDRQLTPDEKRDIIAYLEGATDGNNSPGGNPIGGYGPFTEGFVAWFIGMSALIGLTVWIGSKA